MRRLIVACLLALTLAACSTILEGSQEEVLLTTPGGADSRCYVRNQYFLYVINPPRRFQIERTSQPYKIVCIAPGNRVKTAYLMPGFERATTYNVSNGLVPGVATDLVSGALFRYPDEIIIDFTNMKPRPMPLPDYQRMLDDNPLIKGMEQFRPSVPALQSDENTHAIPLEKRPPGSEDDSFGLLTPADAVNGSNKPSYSSSSGASSSGTTGAPTVTGGPSTSYGTFKTPGTAASSSGTTAPATPANSTTNGSTGSTGIMTHKTWTSTSSGTTTSATGSPASLTP